MKNVFRLIGFITLVAVIGFSFAACNRVAVTGVTLSNTDLYMTIGSSVTLTAIVTPTNATNKSVVWVTSDASVATVNNGIVTAVGAGIAAIAIATVDGQMTATCTVTVNATPTATPAPAPAPTPAPTPDPAPAPTSSGRDSRLVNAANQAWVDNFPAGERDGFIFRADGNCYRIDDYTGTTPGVFAIYGGVAISWTTSGNNVLTISLGGDFVTYTYTVTATTLNITLNGDTSTYTKAVVTIPGI